MKQILLSCLTAILLGTFSSGQERADTSRVEKFRSPDGMMVAVVRSKRAPEATGVESNLLTQEGRVSTGRDYTSPDGEHGYGVTKAAWTPDSHFFVYSLESSGGHQAWHSPVCVLLSQ